MSDTLLPDQPVLEVRGLHVEIAQGFHKLVHAVSGVDLSISHKETLGLVGESGCGKTTTGKAIAGLIRATRGSIIISGTEVTGISAKESRKLRQKVQFIFQDPISSLNPRRKVLNTVMEPMSIWSMGTANERIQRATTLLEQVGLDPELVSDRMPYQLSGGQCQRVSIARALMLSPELLICDEPVSALDVSVQATILNLLNDIQARYQLSMLFISHDLAVVRSISDRIAVMYMGRLCESAPTTEIFDHAMHPYTHELLSSVPSGKIHPSPQENDSGTEGTSSDTSRSDRRGGDGNRNDSGTEGTSNNIDGQNSDNTSSTEYASGNNSRQDKYPPSMPDHDESPAIPIAGRDPYEKGQFHEVPSSLTPPSGCRFHTRCPYADALCVSTQPDMIELSPGHLVACHHPFGM